MYTVYSVYYKAPMALGNNNCELRISSRSLQHVCVRTLALPRLRPIPLSIWLLFILFSPLHTLTVSCNLLLCYPPPSPLPSFSSYSLAAPSLRGISLDRTDPSMAPQVRCRSSLHCSAICNSLHFQLQCPPMKHTVRSIRIPRLTFAHPCNPLI